MNKKTTTMKPAASPRQRKLSRPALPVAKSLAPDQGNPKPLPELLLPPPVLAEPDARLRQQLHRHLLSLSLPAFAALVQAVLERSGYERVMQVGRLSPRGRLLHGGCDLKAYTRTDLETVTTAVQIKQYREPVGRRFLDELRGAMLRLRAEQGLLITTSTFSAAVRSIAEDSEVAPVRLVDGAELIDYLVQYRIGLQERAGRWQLDAVFFKGLEPAAPTGREAVDVLADGVPANVNLDESLNLLIHNDSPALTPQGQARHGRKGRGMTWSTHAILGINTLWLFEILPQGPDPLNVGILAAVAAFGALLPDLDASQSKIKYLSISGLKPFYLPSEALHRWLGHRGLLHSLLGLGIVTLLVLPLAVWWGWTVPLALLLGYASHLAADACTRFGVPLLYPRKQRYHLLPRPLRFVTGSQAEDMLFVLGAVAALCLLLRHLAAF